MSKLLAKGINIPDCTPGAGRIAAVVRIIAANPAAAVSQINSLDTSSPKFEAAGKTRKAEALKAGG